MRNYFVLSNWSLMRKAFAQLPVTVLSAALIGTVMITSAVGYNLYDSAVNKAAQLRLARALAEDEAERIRSAGYDDIIKIEKPNGKLQNGYVKEIVLGKEYREDIGNSVLKHKPVTINVYDSESSFFPLVSIKTEKVSRWYKSGTFDKSDGGIYDETGEEHKGSIKKTGNGTGYVFLKKGAKVNGEVEIYDETNGDIYIYNSIGTSNKKTTIRHIGPATASGYIRLAQNCTINGTVTLENSSNGGLIIETAIPDGTHIAKLGGGTGYLRLAKGSALGKNVKVTNESSGSIVVNRNLNNNSHLIRTGTSDSVLIMDGYINGTIGVNMDDSGKLTMQNSFYDGTSLNYSSSTNKALLAAGNKLSGMVSFVNNSKGNIVFTGKAGDGARLLVSGSGSGKTNFYGTLEGIGNIINDTPGSISIGSSITFHNEKTIRKLGGGRGYLSFNDALVKGDFTLDSDWDGECISEGGIDPAVQKYVYPVFEDGVYVYARGKGVGRLRFAWKLNVLGRVNINVAKNPKQSWGAGYYNNPGSGNVSQILQDGYTYTL